MIAGGDYDDVILNIVSQQVCSGQTRGKQSAEIVID